jgi:hypothetical protein
MLGAGTPEKLRDLVYRRLQRQALSVEETSGSGGDIDDEDSDSESSSENLIHSADLGDMPLGTPVRMEIKTPPSLIMVKLSLGRLLHPK